MACKYYYNGKEFTESELKAAMLAGEFDREAKNMGIDIPSMKVVSSPSIRSKEQVSAFHGSPYEFDRFSTEKIGTGEGHKAFGWGLYFTDVKDIAKHYQSALSKVKSKELWIENGSVEGEADRYRERAANTQDLSLYDLYEERADFLNELSRTFDYTKSLNVSNNPERLKKWADKNVLPFVKDDIGTLYEVSIHKGKTPDQYTWMQWDSKLSENVIDKIKQGLKNNNYEDKLKSLNSEFETLNSKSFDKMIEKTKDIKSGFKYALDFVLEQWDKSSKFNDIVERLTESEQSDLKRMHDILGELGLIRDIGLGLDFKNENAKDIYDLLSRLLGGYKQASLFLLENGIDGIKYPAESLSLGSTSETARGFNYVVFDENAVTIEARSKEQTTGRVTQNQSNRQGAITVTVASLPNVDIRIDGNRFNALLSDPESVRITDASGNVVAIVNKGEVVVDPIATANDDASITSLGYVWMELAKGNDSAVYKQMIEAVKGTQYETDARQADADMQAQGFPAMSEEQILQRAAAEAIKDRANAYNDRTFGQKIKDAIKKFGEFLNKLFGMSKNYDFLEMTIGDYADIAARSLMGAKPISSVSNLDLEDIIKNGPYVSVPGGLLGANQRWMDRAITKMGKSRAFKTIVPRNFSNAKSLLKFWFSNKYQDKINTMNSDKSNLIERKMREIRDTVFGFRNAFKDFTKGMTDDQKNDLINDISEYLGGKQAPIGPSLSTGAPIMSTTIADLRATYPKATELMNIVEQMRASIDSLSKEIQATIDPTSELYGIIDGNMGIYLNRGYAAFRDSRWNESMFPKGKNTPLNFEESGRSPEMDAIYRKAIDYIVNEFNMSPEEADVKLKEYARLSNDQKDPLQEIKGKMGTAIDDLLKKRQDMPIELRAFFGEYTDPVQKFYHTMENMIRYAENKKFLMKLKDLGMNKIFFEKPSLQFNEEIAGSDTYSPMAGLYTTPEVADLLRGTDNSLKIEMLRNIASYWKAFKTVGSIKTTIRNFQSNIFFQFANGRAFGNMASFKKGKEGGGLSLAAKELFRSPSQFNNELVELGIINSGISAELKSSVTGFVNSIYDDGIETLQDTEKVTDKAKFIIKKTGATAAKVYEFMDNVWRVTAYMSELDDCKRMFPKLSDAELKKVAAERFKETHVVYDKAPNIVKRLAASPFVGTFPTFTSEAMRTSISIPRLAIQDILDGASNKNLAQFAIGVRRLSGFSMTAGVLAGLGGLVASGVMTYITGAEPPDEDEERVLYEGAPDYAKNNSRIITTPTKPGEISYYELDFLNPWNFAFKSYNAYMRSDKYDPEKNPSIEAAWTLLEPFLGQEGVYSIGQQWSNNDDGRGGMIRDPQDPWSKQMSDAIPWAMKNLVPGFVTFGYDVYNSSGVNPDYDKGRKTSGEIIKNEFLGFKQQKISTESAFSNRLQNYYTPKITNQLNEINNIVYKYETKVKQAAETGDDNIRKEYLKEYVPDINQANIHLWRMQDDIRKYANSLRATGVPSEEISKRIDNALKYKSLGGVASFDIKSGALSRGEYHIRTLTPEMLQILGYNSEKEYVDFLNSTLK